MLSINRLNIRLPNKYSQQAPMLANRVAQLLAEMDCSGLKSHKRMAIPVIHIEHGTSIEMLARQIARSIHATLRGN